jgi:hypothetical protein
MGAAAVGGGGLPWRGPVLGPAARRWRRDGTGCAGQAGRPGAGCSRAGTAARPTRTTPLNLVACRAAHSVSGHRWRAPRPVPPGTAGPGKPNHERCARNPPLQRRPARIGDYRLDAASKVVKRIGSVAKALQGRRRAVAKPDVRLRNEAATVVARLASLRQHQRREQWSCYKPWPITLVSGGLPRRIRRTRRAPGNRSRRT